MGYAFGKKPDAEEAWRNSLGYPLLGATRVLARRKTRLQARKSPSLLLKTRFALCKSPSRP
jgi:hypothetical protein